MKHCFRCMVVGFIFLMSCKVKTTKEETGKQKDNEVNLIKRQSMSATSKTDTSAIILEPDSLLNLRMEDTIDCGAVINALFRRSCYKFPVADSYKKEELTAVIEDAKDSILSIKIMLVDSTADYRQTVDWMKLNCKNKKLEDIPVYGPDPKPIVVKYDVRILYILMRKCILDYN